VVVVTYDAKANGEGCYAEAIAAKRAKLLMERIPAAKRVEVIGDCELILGDLKKAFATFAATGVTIEDIAYTSGGVEYPRESESSAGAKISITVKYDTLLGNPYSQ
jgi:hypothetical protein